MTVMMIWIIAISWTLTLQMIARIIMCLLFHLIPIIILLESCDEFAMLIQYAPRRRTFSMHASNQ